MPRFIIVSKMRGGEEAVNIEKIVNLSPIIEHPSADNPRHGTLIIFDNKDAIRVNGEFTEIARILNAEKNNTTNGPTYL